MPSKYLIEIWHEGTWWGKVRDISSTRGNFLDILSSLYGKLLTTIFFSAADVAIQRSFLNVISFFIHVVALWGEPDRLNLVPTWDDKNQTKVKFSHEHLFAEKNEENLTTGFCG